MTFEEWIQAPPYERGVEKYGTDSAWPGHYRDYEVQLAWEAWQAAQPNVEGLISTCVPGGNICDPQQVADAIRDYFGSTPAFDVASATPHVGIRREADARLMAAAPDLLGALEEIVHVTECIPVTSVGLEAELDRARAAIAKAKGVSDA